MFRLLIIDLFEIGLTSLFETEVTLYLFSRFKLGFFYVKVIFGVFYLMLWVGTTLLVYKFMVCFWYGRVSQTANIPRLAPRLSTDVSEG